MSQAHCAIPASSRVRGVATVAALLMAMLGWSLKVAPPAAAATAEKIAPAAAPEGVGIVIAGTNLTDTSSVVFLGTPDPLDDVVAPNFAVLEAKKVAVQVPAGVQSGPVQLTTPEGVVETLVPFTVYKAPTITAVSATWGKPDDVLTISGDNLLGAKKPVIAFGTKKVGPLAEPVPTQTELQVKVPGGLAGGPVPLTVTTTGGTARSSFVIGPAVKAIAPKNGTTVGGTVASITGAGFTGVENFTDDPATAGVDERLDGVTIGGTRVTKLISVSDKELIVVVPAGTDPAAPVVVRTKHGSTIPESGAAVLYAYQPIPKVTGVSQNYNVVGTAAPIVFTGENLTATTSVLVGGLPPTDVVADPVAGTLTVTPAVSAKAAVSAAAFANTTPSGVAFKASVPFGYVTAPVVGKLAPATGPEGTSVLVSGSGFTSDTAVQFGTTAASCTVVSFIALKCAAPAGTGVVDVTVTTGAGVSAATLTTQFTYTAGVAPTAPVVGLPSIAPLLPAYGATGSTVDIRGANLGSLSKVEFTGEDNTWVEAPNFLVVGIGRAVVTVPADAVTGEVRLTNAAGRVTTLGRVFTKTVPPSVDSIDVVGDTSFGATVGDLVTIKGAGLIIKGAKTFVTIGGKPAPILIKPIPNPRTIVVRVPPSVGGREEVVVSTPLGTAASEVWLYQIPEVKVLKPITYTRTGGTVVTIAGSNFTGVDNVTVNGGRLSAVTFGGVNVAKFVFMSDKSVVAVTSPGSASADHVVVTTQHDGRYGNSDGKTRSVNAPMAQIDTVSPDAGPTGAIPPAVTLTGMHLKIDSIVKFGSALATVQSAAPDGTSMVVIPPTRSTTATVGITITNYDDGDELTSTKASAYTYELQPATITGLSAGTAVPGTPLTISGTSFEGVTSVKFGTVSVPYTVANSSTILVNVPATPSGTAGTTVDVTVVNGTGEVSTGDPATADDWMWDNSPTLTSLSASTGARNTTITINGSNFVGITNVRFGYTNAVYTVVDQNTITATVPTTPVGAGGQTVDVVVEIGASVSQPISPTADNWTWMSAATITAMDLHTAPAGTTVTVTGTNFVGLSGATAVTMNSKAATSYTVISDTSLTFVVPPADANGGNSAGRSVAIRVTNGSGLVSTASPATADDWLIQ